jgi:hypothetical protein
MFEELLSVAAASGALVSVLTSMVQALRARRRSQKAIERLVISGDVVELHHLRSDEVRQLLSDLLDSEEKKIISATPQGVTLDIGQISSAAQIAPSQTKRSLARLVEIGLMEAIKKGGQEKRFRKLLSDDFAGGEI